MSDQSKDLQSTIDEVVGMVDQLEQTPATPEANAFEAAIANLEQQIAAMDSGLLAVGGQTIRIVPGTTSEIPFAGVTTFADWGEWRLARLYDRTQNSATPGNMHSVTALGLLTKGTKFGIMRNGEKIYLPMYESDEFAAWSRQIHYATLEFQNPVDDVRFAAKAYMEAHGVVPFRSQGRRGAEIPARTSTTNWDVQTPGSTILERWETAIPIRNVTLRPDERVDTLLTRYQKRDTGEWVRRDGFTGFPDALLAAAPRVIAAAIARKVNNTPETTRDLLNALQDLSTLTGRSLGQGDGPAIAGMPLRPTWTQLTVPVSNTNDLILNPFGERGTLAGVDNRPVRNSDGSDYVPTAQVQEAEEDMELLPGEEHF